MENLNIIFIKAKASKINFKTANDLFEVHIDESYSPELELEDQSFLLKVAISEPGIKDSYYEYKNQFSNG